MSCLALALMLAGSPAHAAERSGALAVLGGTGIALGALGTASAGLGFASSGSPEPYAAAVLVGSGFGLLTVGNGLVFGAGLAQAHRVGAPDTVGHVGLVLASVGTASSLGALFIADDDVALSVLAGGTVLSVGGLGVGAAQGSINRKHARRATVTLVPDPLHRGLALAGTW